LLRCYLLKCGNSPCAFGIGWQLNGIFYFHETAYDPTWAKYSPGKSLLHLMIKDCFAINRPRLFYFGPGEAHYKKWFANNVGQETTFVLMKRGPINSAKITAHQIFRESVDLVKGSFWRSTARAKRR